MRDQLEYLTSKHKVMGSYLKHCKIGVSIRYPHSNNRESEAVVSLWDQSYPLCCLVLHLHSRYPETKKHSTTTVR